MGCTLTAQDTFEERIILFFAIKTLRSHGASLFGAGWHFIDFSSLGGVG